MAETIAVLSLKGGTGKTTTVRTLADVFRRIGLDVLAVDLDPQGNLSDYFDVPPDASPTVADVLAGDAKAPAATHDGIVPATPILAEVERSLSGKIGRELVLRKALRDARTRHDLILIDCPPARRWRGAPVPSPRPPRGRARSPRPRRRSAPTAARSGPRRRSWRPARPARAPVRA